MGLIDLTGFGSALNALSFVYWAVAIFALCCSGRASAPALMRHSQALLVPSHSETFGLVALEGAASDYDLIAG